LGLLYFGARYLDPELGAWTSPDKERQFFSPYLYVGNKYNPINATDPNGLEVNGTYNKSTGVLSLTDIQTGATASGKFFSGGFLGADPIPSRNFEILERAGRPGFYRLDAVDANPRNDVDDATGRTAFRLHAGTRSLGCITACTQADFDQVADLLNKTSTEKVTDNRQPGFWSSLKQFFLGREESPTIEKYGEIEVVDE
jgi:hypothetical protein